MTADKAANRREARRSPDDHAVRQGSRESRPPRELPARGLHERRDLDRVADLNAALAASFRRAFMGVAR